MANIRELLLQIQSRPGLYTGKSLSALAFYLRGYLHALDEAGNPDPFFDAFPDWVRQELECRVPTSWEKIILFHSVSEEEAFDTFYRLLDKYAER